MDRNWMVRGNVTFTQWKQHIGKEGLWDPTPLLNGAAGLGSWPSSCDTCPGTTTVASVNGTNGFINSRCGLELTVDVFNALNAQTVLWRDFRLYTPDGTDLSSGSNNIQELQSPRIVRLGARLTF
jgi:hypothetical protein